MRSFSPFTSEASLFEACERRLVLSAQPLLDALAISLSPGQHCLPSEPAALAPSVPEPHEFPAAINPHWEPQIDSTLPNAGSLELQLREAHLASGWDQVQRQYGLTGAKQTVAIIDSGVAWDHVALGGGYGPGYRVVGGWDFTEEQDALPYDDGPAGFHGTHVAGIIGSNSNLNSGVAPDVDLVALRVFNDVGQGQLAWVEQALSWVHTHRNAFENPITTVNLSLGTSWNADTIPNWATLENELQLLANEGIMVVASAGNSFQTYHAPGLSYPAASPYVLPVASVGDDGELSDFSQRNSRVLAAPGENINSTVPDYVYGRDGIFNDWANASGTSMSAPYVAGASVLVRQAMEMAGIATINLTTISDHLHATADSIYDTITGASYDRLNLAAAIDALLPDDIVGDTVPTASTWNLSQNELNGWINHIGDQDVYRFTAATDGLLQLDASSDWADSLQWSLHTNGQTLATGQFDSRSIDITAGSSYELVVSAPQRIGSFQFNVDFTTFNRDDSTSEGTVANTSDLGEIDYLTANQNAGSHYRAQATRDGTFTVQWTNTDAPQGSLVVGVGGQSLSDATWEQGRLRIDIQVHAGDWLDIQLPGQSSDSGELALANIFAHAGTRLTGSGTLNSDSISIDLTAGLGITFGEIGYHFSTGEVEQFELDGYGNSDSLQILGSSQSEKVELAPDGSTIENSHVKIVLSSIEQISFASGGGADRVYLYDSDTDDTLIAHPRYADLKGVGYRFEVADVDRVFIHATGGGQDYAYLYDSVGNDQLSVRPQFTSMSGDNFFNYVRGFERVYAYANAGGLDTANIYDSAGDDRFTTNGSSASIVGPGFSSYTKSFEWVQAYADAGGNDRATLYGSDQQTMWQRGSDFVRFEESIWNREARGFDSVETYVAGQLQSLASPAGLQANSVESTLVENVDSGGNRDPAFSDGPPLMSIDDRGFTRFIGEQTYEDSPWRTNAQLDGEDYLGEHVFDDSAVEMQILRDVVSLREWLASDVELPEDALLDDPDLELELLDEIFRQHDLL